MPKNGSRPEKQASASFEETLFQESANLGVVHASFEGFTRSSFEEVIDGYSSLRVLTYSVAEPVLSISRYRAEKAREAQQQRAREEQERRQRKIGLVVAVIGAAIAVPGLLNQQAIAALLVWFPPAAWLLDWLFDIHELNVDDNTHLRIILAAQLVIIAMLAVLFYIFIHWLFGEPSERASDQK